MLHLLWLRDRIVTISMHLIEFELAIPGREQPQNYDLERAITGIGLCISLLLIFMCRDWVISVGIVSDMVTTTEES